MSGDLLRLNRRRRSQARERMVPADLIPIRRWSDTPGFHCATASR